MCVACSRITGGELFDDIVAREFYSEKDARYSSHTPLIKFELSNVHACSSTDVCCKLTLFVEYCARTPMYVVY